MNNNEHFDNHVKGQFSNYSPEVPPHTWEKIMQKKKKKPGGLLFFLAGRTNLLILLCVLLAGGSGAWLLNSTLFTHGEKEEAVTGGKGSNNETNVTGQPKITPAEIPVTANTQTAVTPGNTNDYADANSGSMPGRVKSPSKMRTNLVASSVQHKTIARAAIRHSNSEPVTDNNENNDENNTGDATTAITLPIGGTMLGRLLYAAPYSYKRTEPELQRSNRQTPSVAIPGCPGEENAAGNKKYFEAYGSLDYGLRSMKDTGNSAYLQQRKESTKFSSAFSGGIRYTRVFSNGMSVRGGLNYSQINEKFTYVQGNVINIIYIINANGDTTGSYTTTGTRYKTTHNKYRSVDVPLLIGYEMGNGRLHTNINAGPVINIYSWQKGEVLGTDGKPVSITTGKSSPAYGFKTNAGIGFMGAVSFYYKLNDRYHILAEPYFRYNFSQMNNEAQTFRQKYNTLGLRLGIRMDIP